MDRPSRESGILHRLEAPMSTVDGIGTLSVALQVPRQRWAIRDPPEAPLHGQRMGIDTVLRTCHKRIDKRLPLICLGSRCVTSPGPSFRSPLYHSIRLSCHGPEVIRYM